MTFSQQEILEALEDLAIQADEDCPGEYRSKHFRGALKRAFAIINQVVGEEA